MNALELEQIYLRRGEFLLRNINFAIGEGEFVALEGRSGAGKTTLIELIGNAILADAGCIRYFGVQMYEDEANIRRRMSVMYDSPNMNTEFTAGRMAKEIGRFEPFFEQERFARYAKELQLDTGMRIKHYSKGMQKKYMLALALARTPELLVMDEPTGGLDEGSREDFYRLLEDYQKERSLTILFSTHHVQDVATLAGRNLRIEAGALAEQEEAPPDKAREVGNATAANGGHGIPAEDGGVR